MTQKPSPHRLTEYLITVGLLLFSFAMLSLIGIDVMHMRPDEHLTFHNMRFSFYDSMVELATGNNQAPLWWMNTWVWQHLVGTHEVAVRFNSILLSMLTLSVVYCIGRQWFGKPRFGWFAVGLLTVNAYFFIYALEMRMYALALLLTALSMRFFHAWLTKRTPQSAIWYGLSAALLLYTHYYLGFVILAQMAYFAVFHLLDWRLVKQGIIAGLTAFVVWLPGIIILYGQLQFISFGDAGGLKIPTEETNLQSVIELVQISSNGLFFIYLPLIIFGALRLWNNRGYRISLAWLLLSPALVLIINTQVTIYTVRYTSYLAPAIAIAAGASLAALPAKNIRRVSFTALVLASAIGVPADVTDDCYPNVNTFKCNFAAIGLVHYLPNRIPHRDILTYIADHYQPGDVLYVQQDSNDLYKQDQFRRYLPAQLLATQTADVTTANQARRVWFITDDWFDENVRAAFNDLEEEHRVMAVAGDCTRHWCYLAQLMVAPPNEYARYFGDVLGFRGIDITELSLKDEKITTLLWWDVTKIPAHDYSISLQLLAPDGTLISQVDRPIQPPDADAPIPTTELQPDDIYIDARELALPVQAGTYDLQLVVYQWWDGERLRLPDGSDALQIQSITIDNSLRLLP